MAKPDMIGMVVADMPAALRFYRLIGLDIPPEADSQHHVEVRANGYRLAFDLQEVVRSFDPAWEPPQGSSRGMGMAFLCDSPAEVDRLCQAVAAAGYAVKKEPWDAFWGQRYAQVVDPDGNSVDLFCPL